MLPSMTLQSPHCRFGPSLQSVSVPRVSSQSPKDGMSAATVKNSVLKVGQKVTYGVPNVEADVLKDQSQTCLWCWDVMAFPFFFFFSKMLI